MSRDSTGDHHTQATHCPSCCRQSKLCKKNHCFIRIVVSEQKFNLREICKTTKNKSQVLTKLWWSCSAGRHCPVHRESQSCWPIRWPGLRARALCWGVQNREGASCPGEVCPQLHLCSNTPVNDVSKVVFHSMKPKARVTRKHTFFGFRLWIIRQCPCSLIPVPESFFPGLCVSWSWLVNLPQKSHDPFLQYSPTYATKRRFQEEWKFLRNGQFSGNHFHEFLPVVSAVLAAANSAYTL